MMRTALPVAAVFVFALALGGAPLVHAETPVKSPATDASNQLLNQSTFAESEDPTQVREEKAIEKKDGMDGAAGTATPGAKGATQDGEELPKK